MSICPHILLLIYQCVFQDLIPVYIVWQHWNLKTCIKLVRKAREQQQPCGHEYMPHFVVKEMRTFYCFPVDRGLGVICFNLQAHTCKTMSFQDVGDLQLESGSTIKPHQLWDFGFPLCDFSHPLDKKYQFSHSSRWKSPHKTDQKILVLKMASEPQRILFEKNSCSPTSHPS